jgi:hypothetical protein
MGQEDSVKNGEKMEASEGVWVVLKFDGTYGIVGRVSGHKKLNDNIRQQCLHPDVLKLDIAFDYAEMFRPIPVKGPDGNAVMTPQGPQMAMGREPLITNVGFIYDHETTVYVRDWKRLSFFDDLKGADKRRYIEFRDSAIHGSAQRRLEESGLTSAVAGATGINPNDPRLKRLPDDENGKPHFKIDLRPQQ